MAVVVHYMDDRHTNALGVPEVARAHLRMEVVND
jgi:hypothetical protein